MFVPGGFILGMMAGLGLAFLVELMNDLLCSPSDVMRHLKVPLMGMVCHADDDEDIEGVDLYHVVRQAPYSIMSECYRQLRTNLKLSGSGDAAKKTLLITSAQAEDGKTTVAVNLASALLDEDRRVLLIDTNFRRPAANRLFPHSQPNGTPVDSSYGLSNYLMGQCDQVDQVVRESGIAGLYIIDCGPLPANPRSSRGWRMCRRRDWGRPELPDARDRSPHWFQHNWSSTPSRRAEGHSGIRSSSPHRQKRS